MSKINYSESNIFDVVSKFMDILSNFANITKFSVPVLLRIGFLEIEESYCQIWCMPRKSSGDLVGLFDLFSVNKCHAFNDLCQVFEAA